MPIYLIIYILRIQLEFMNRKYLVSIILIISSMCRVLNLDAKTLQDSCTLSLEIEGKEYNELVLKVICHQIGNVKIYATKSANMKWMFSIPDSIYERHYSMQLYVVDSIVHQLCFKVEDNKPIIADFSIGPGETNIKALFLSSKEFPKMPVFNNKNVIMDNLKVINPDINILASLNLMRIGFDMLGDKREKAFSNFLSLTKEYGDTHYCTAQLHNKINLFKSKDEIYEFYSVLSNEQKDSYFGYKIKSYLDLVFFPQIELPTIYENKPHNIITDSTRYTLVIFSASWCGPCHKQIPILQKIYSDLNKYGLDIVYVSMDEFSTVKNWKIMVEENKIPWISFLPGNKLNEVSDLYSIKAIPTTYLVYPGGKFAKVDVRNKHEREGLYNIIQDSNIENEDV